jgi:hypothetical protein
MKTFVHVLYSFTCLLAVTIIGLVLTKHLVVTSTRRMASVVNDGGDVLFQAPTNVVDYAVNFVR